MSARSFKLSAAVISAAMLVWFSGAVIGFPVHAQPENRLKIVATTTLIAEIVQELGGDAVRVATMISPATCPGHFDVTLDDMKLLSHAQIFLLHCWQGRRFGEDIIRASGNRTLKRVVLEEKGNWMVPAVQTAATDRIVAVLVEADPAHADVYRTAGERRKAEVQRVGSAQAKRLREADTGSIAVLANDMQADMIRWAGFQIVGTFGRGEDMSPRDMQANIRQGRAKSVRLVVDNLQSGKQAGIIIAKEIGAEQVTLSNFPGALPDTGSWAKAFEKNVDLLLAAIGKP